MKSDEQCTESSWRGKTKNRYGPGGYNRCLQVGNHQDHVDDFGHVWRLPGRIIRMDMQLRDDARAKLKEVTDGTQEDR